nr:S8 family serine peptidase [Oscillatoria laete-virens]
MTEFEPGSAFIQEAARRALSHSELGYIVISDRSEAAQFSSALPHEGNFNFGDYQDVKTFAMRIGDTFGIMLVPDGTVQQVFDLPEIGGATRPLFSLATANPVEGFHFGQIADVTGEGNTFVMEDLRIDANSDRDYNDIAFQLLGATGQASLLNDVIDSAKDWRTSEIGQELINYAQSATSAHSIKVQPGSEVAPVTKPTPELEDSTTDAIAPEIESPETPETPISPPPEEATHQDPTPEAAPIPVDESPTETNPPVVDSSELPVADSSELPVTDSSEPPVAETALPTSDLENIETNEDSNLTSGELNFSKSLPVTPEKQPEATQPPSSNHPQEGAAGNPLNNESNLLDPNTEPHTLQWGTFVVGDTGKVGVDFLFDGGAYRGELAIFSLEGMENLQPGSPEFIREAAMRSLSKSPLGHVVISDSTDAARFQGELGEPNRNNGQYQGIKPVTMNPGDRFGMMLVPRGTVQQVHQNPTIGGTTRPLFSLTSNPSHSQIADLTGKGNTFAFEDLSLHGNSDRDYNDIIFQVRGATGKAPVISEVIDPNKDWTDTPLGKSIIDYGKSEECQDSILKSLPSVVRYAIERSSNLDSHNPEALAATRRWVVGVPPCQSSLELATLLGAKDLGATGFIPNTYTWEFPASLTPQEVATYLTDLAGVEFAYPMVGIDLELLSTPKNEPFVNNGQPSGSDKYQWHLRSDGNAADANVTKAWDIPLLNNPSQQVRGRGVVIGIVDDGIDYHHLDLKERYRSDLDWDFNENDDDPHPTYKSVFYPHNDPHKKLEEAIEKGVRQFRLSVGATGDVTDVNVRLDIKHGQNADLNISLFAPTELEEIPGIVRPIRQPSRPPIDPDEEDAVKLVTQASGHNFKQTTFDDGAAIKIQDAIAPYTGSFRPEDPLSSFNNSLASGEWVLKIEDTVRKNSGTLNHWSLEIETVNPHGTSVAGIAAASGTNNYGGSGVAPEASLTGIRLIANGDAAYTANRQITQALKHKNQEIHIYNNSWKPLDRLVTLEPEAVLAMDEGTKMGRNGLGSIFVFGAGNERSYGDNVNYNPLANSRYAIAVAAIGEDGKFAPYSEPGAALLVSAYSSNEKTGISTTDLAGSQGYDKNSDYTHKFGGTSAAAPFVSGVIALMLEANPNLTWRDVQHLLVETAKKNDPTGDWDINGAGYDISYDYGFGAVDAEAAVRLAQTWTNVAPETFVSLGKKKFEKALPIDNNGKEISDSVTIDEDLRLEKVEVMFDATHPYRGDLEVTLVHAYTDLDGNEITTESVLAQLRDNDDGDDYKSWVFTSTRHWGETSKGTWTLKVRDLDPEREDSNGKPLKNEGYWKAWDLTLFGTVSAAPTLTAIAPLSSAVVNQQFTITYEDLLKASDARDANGDAISFLIDGISSGTLTKNGVPIIPGETTLSPQEFLVWTPTRPGDTVPAFTVRAKDSQLVSATPVQVSARVETLPIPLDNWNTRLINRTPVDFNERPDENSFNNPAAILDLGWQSDTRLDGGLRLLRDWGANPASGVQDDYFAMESHTRKQFEAGKHYQFTTQSDDGVGFRLKNVRTGEWVDDERYWKAWTDRSVFDPPIDIPFTVPETGEYDVYVYYYERTSGSKVYVEIGEVSTERVSVTSNGTQASGGAPDISADGRYVTFSSISPNFVPGDTNGVTDVFVRDRLTGQVTRVSVASDGTQANSASSGSAISADGRYIAFWSVASNLVAEDNNGQGDIFVHDRQTGQTERISTQGNSTYYADINADGRYITYISSFPEGSSDTGITSGDYLFLHDRQTGETTRITWVAEVSGSSPSISADGKYIAFASFKNPVTEQLTRNSHVYVYDIQTQQFTIASVASNGNLANMGSGEPTISGDGRYIAFASLATNLVPEDDDINSLMYDYDIFVHDRLTGQTTLASVDSDEKQGNSNSNYPQLSWDGRYMAFRSYATNLVEGDTNATTGIPSADIFLRDLVLGHTTRVSVASDGTESNGHSDQAAISADGQFVAFMSGGSNLVEGDTNQTGDVFVREV